MIFWHFQEVVIDLLAEAMAKESTGFLVDGFPATIEQVELTYSWSLSQVLFIRFSQD